MSSAINISAELDRSKFSQAWRAEATKFSPAAVCATVDLGYSSIRIESSAEARELAAAFMVAAVALDRLETIPELEGVKPSDVAGALQAALAAVVDVQAASNGGRRGGEPEDLETAAAAARTLLEESACRETDACMCPRCQRGYGQ